MAPTEDRFARHERRWDCRRGTPLRNDSVLLKAKVWLVTLDTNSPHICLGQVGLLVGQVGYWGELAVVRNDLIQA